MFDVESYLKQFTPRQWLESYIAYLQSYNVTQIPLEMMWTGFNLAGPDGWKMIAPSWIRQFEGGGIRPLEHFKVNYDEDRPNVETS